MRTIFIASLVCLVQIIFAENDLWCEDRLPTTTWTIEAKLTGEGKKAKTMFSTDEIFYAGVYEDTKGILGKFDKHGEHQWGYKLHLPVQSLEFDAKETIVAVTLVNQGVALEVHHYNATSGVKKFLYEY